MQEFVTKSISKFLWWSKKRDNFFLMNATYDQILDW
jgi:hypothetical protein